MTTTPEFDFRVDDAGNIDLYVDGERSRIMGMPDVSRVRTRDMQNRILRALDDARILGAEHGTCDRQAELAALMNGNHTPGCAIYTIRSEYPYEGKPVHSVDRVMNGHTTAVLTDLRSGGQAAEAANALSRAFKIGGGYGPPTVHRVSIAKRQGPERYKTKSNGSCGRWVRGRDEWWLSCWCGLHVTEESSAAARDRKARHEQDPAGDQTESPCRCGLHVTEENRRRWA